MPYFAIKPTDSEMDVCICKEENIEDIDPDSFLGTVKTWEVREIDALEAGELLFELAPGTNLGDLVRCVSMKLSDTPFGE